MALLDTIEEGPSPHAMAGRYACWVLHRKLAPPPDNARDFHDMVETALAHFGFRVYREWPVPVRESGRGLGYIDLVAEFRKGIVALELDRRMPRSKSMDKLRSLDAFRIIVLRGAHPWPLERGIDAIISVPVLQA